MKLFLLLTLIFGSALAAPTLKHILGLKEAVRDYFHGSEHNQGYGYGRGYERPIGFGSGSGTNDNSQVVYIQNGQAQQQSTNGFSSRSPGLGGIYSNSQVEKSLGNMYGQYPYFGSPQATANAISSSWSNSGVGSPTYHGNSGGATAQSSASAWSSRNAGVV